MTILDENNAIEVFDLKKHFGDVKALDGISFYVPKGTVFSLLGPNGAGKTTTIRILTTTSLPTSGKAFVNTISVEHEPQLVRESIGLAGQYAAVDDLLTGRENLRMIGALTHVPKKEIKSRADELLDLFSLQDAADRPVKTYSGGMRRRLDLAASLVHAPDVLFLDEPTTGLDPKSRLDLWGVVRALVDNGTTVLLTTQYLEEADRLADYLAIIDNGSIVEQGTPTELKKLHDVSTLDEVFLKATGHGIKEETDAS